MKSMQAPIIITMVNEEGVIIMMLNGSSTYIATCMGALWQMEGACIMHHYGMFNIDQLYGKWIKGALMGASLWDWSGHNYGCYCIIARPSMHACAW